MRIGQKGSLYTATIPAIRSRVFFNDGDKLQAVPPIWEVWRNAHNSIIAAISNTRILTVKQRFKGTFEALFMAILVITLSACGGGSSDNNPPQNNQPELSQGVFLDSAVEGLTYSSGEVSGITNGEGRFEYEVGGTITFSIGSVTLGSTQAADIITPLELVSDAADETDAQVVNMLRFLQTLDNDANLDNGIQITQTMQDLIIDTIIDFDQSIEDFGNDGSVQTLISTLTSASDAGARILISAEEALLHFQETLADITGNPTGSDDGDYCAANTPSLSSARGNVYVFDVQSGDCLGIAEDNSPKKTIPLNILEIIVSEDITENVQVDIESTARLYLQSEGFNFDGFDLNYSFEITNNSTSDYCIDLSGDFNAKDADGNILEDINIYGTNSGPELFLNPAQRCFSAGYTQSYIAQSTFISREDFDKIASLEIGRAIVKPLDNAPSTKAEALDAQMSWTISADAPNYPALEVTFTNNIGRDIRLDKSQHKVWFFDDEGYALSSNSIRLHEALGFGDDDDLSEDDYIILGNGEVFSLLDAVADNAVVTPSRATKARVYLNWDYVTP
ncbi:MAG: hypothetical protein COA45_04030 [Zetaproteobacteria bacterium]|nr:MAG: hypothetical protein COA45_04030 [Zetaproteobacteria bacterium]